VCVEGASTLGDLVVAGGQAAGAALRLVAPFIFGLKAAESSRASPARLRWCMYFIVVCTSA